MEEAIVADKLTKRFGKLVAVNRVSFTVREGEFFGFLGPNGAGKTTTVRMLTGVLPPDEGKALVLGFDISKETLKVKERIGVVPEGANVYPDLTVWQNLMLMAELYGLSRGEAKARVRELLDFVGLLERKDEKARRLSKGLRQRLLICTALVHRPSLIFLDEPTVGLDVKSARQVRNLLRRLNTEEGVTVFLTTHNMWEAEELCQRVAIINRGRLVAVSKPEDLKRSFGRFRVVEVYFDKPVKTEELSTTLGCKASPMGNGCRVYVEDVDEAIFQILSFSRRRGLKIVSLSVSRPNLEEVFLRIVGGGENGV